MLGKKMSNKPIPLVVDWQVTDTCNRSCIFCYGPKEGSGTLSLTESKMLIDRISIIGAKVLGLTGGETLIHDEIQEILSYAKSKGLAIGLNTNCDLYIDNRDMILKTVDVLEVPIEYASDKKHNHYRGSGSFENIIMAIDDSYCNSDIFFRIGTVLHSQNIDDLLNIEKILHKYKDKVIYWKIYEYISYSNKEMGSITNSHERFNSLSEMYRDKGLGDLIGSDKIIFDSFQDRKHSYFLINSTGSVFLPSEIDGRPYEKKLGNLLDDDFHKVVDSWKENVDCEGYTSCKRCVFRKIGYI